MEIYKNFEIAFDKLINLVKNCEFKKIPEIENLYSDLGSISNIEMYFNPVRDIFSELKSKDKIELIKRLTDIDANNYMSRETNWYFANLFNMIFSVIYFSLTEENQKELLNYILSNRKNERVPFAKDLDLKFNSIEKFNELPLKKFRQFQYK